MAPDRIDEHITNITRNVPGTLSHVACRFLWETVTKLPNRAAIIEISPENGRSTVIIAKAIQIAETDIDIFAVGWEASQAHRDGTFRAFLTSLEQFHLSKYIVPVIAHVPVISKLFNKRSANLVIVQIPMLLDGAMERICSAIEQAKFTIRKGGQVLACCPSNTISGVFEDAVAKSLGNDPDFHLYEVVDGICAYTYIGEPKAPKPAPVKHGGGRNKPKR